MYTRTSVGGVDSYVYGDRGMGFWSCVGGCDRVRWWMGLGGCIRTVTLFSVMTPEVVGNVSDN